MAPKKYQNYRIIEGFRGKTQEDLKNNIDSYCKKLIEFINEPVVDCPHCKGRGIVDEETLYEVTKEKING
jgi:DNA-directed RNA polymerase subunit RPC12/RpoP